METNNSLDAYDWRVREEGEAKQRIAFLFWISCMIFCIFLCHYINAFLSGEQIHCFITCLIACWIHMQTLGYNQT